MPAAAARNYFAEALADIEKAQGHVPAGSPAGGQFASGSGGGVGVGAALVNDSVSAADKGKVVSPFVRNFFGDHKDPTDQKKTLRGLSDEKLTSVAELLSRVHSKYSTTDSHSNKLFALVETEAKRRGISLTKHSYFLKAEVAKVSDELGLVFGFAIVSKVDGEDYFDVQGDHIPEESMLAVAVDFMEKSRVAKDMHTGEQIGDVVFAFPLTTELAKALDMTTKYTGLMIAMKPSAGVLEKYRSGEYKGFSIGGSRGEDEDAD